METLQCATELRVCVLAGSLGFVVKLVQSSLEVSIRGYLVGWLKKNRSCLKWMKTVMSQLFYVNNRAGDLNRRDDKNIDSKSKTQARRSPSSYYSLTRVDSKPGAAVKARAGQEDNKIPFWRKSEPEPETA